MKIQVLKIGRTACCAAGLIASSLLPIQANASSLRDPEVGISDWVSVNLDRPDLSKLITLRLSLSADQQTKLGPVIAAQSRRLDEIERNRALSSDERHSERSASWETFKTEMSPSLDAEQKLALENLVQEIEEREVATKRRPILPLISLAYETYFPTDAKARAIFGDYTSRVKVGLRDFVNFPSKRYILSFAIDSQNIGNSNDKLFVFSPQVSFEYRVPIAGMLSSYARVSAGPAYMDYSYDTPSGDHFGAKRLGADAELEVGLRYSRFQLAVGYHAMTQPSDLNFNGISASLTWIVVRF